jgi:hypothetical protein
MRSRQAWLLSSLVLTGCGGNPAVPEAPAAFRGSYVFAVEASSACSATGTGSLPFRSFRWDVSASESSGRASFALPPTLDRLSLDDLRLELGSGATTVEGELSGGLRVDRTLDAGWTVRFNDDRDGPARLSGPVGRARDGRPEILRGTLSGRINVGLYFSSQGGICTATDHSWSLRPI